MEEAEIAANQEEEPEEDAPALGMVGAASELARRLSCFIPS